MQIYVKTTPADRTAAASTVAEVRDQLTGIVGDGAYVNLFTFAQAITSS